MKMLAKCLGSVALVLAVIFAYLIAGTRLQVTISNEEIIPASQESELFYQALREIESGALGDRQYASLSGTDIDRYSFIALDLSIGSFGLLPCEWVRAGIAPKEGDVALLSSDLPDVQPLSRVKARLWILTEADRAQTGHSAWIEYYAFGYQVFADARKISAN